VVTPRSDGRLHRSTQPAGDVLEARARAGIACHRRQIPFELAQPGLPQAAGPGGPNLVQGGGTEIEQLIPQLVRRTKAARPSLGCGTRSA
jgi:hypothetical protein